MKNLFYDLPEDIKRKIHKQVHIMEINPKINEYIPPGDFLFLITKDTDESDIQWFNILSEDYQNINKIGQEAWDYLKNNTITIDNIVLNKQFTKIMKCMSKKHSEYSIYRSLKTMEFIAKIGWKEYVTINKQTIKQMNEIYFN